MRIILIRIQLSYKTQDQSPVLYKTRFQSPIRPKTQVQSPLSYKTRRLTIVSAKPRLIFAISEIEKNNEDFLCNMVFSAKSDYNTVMRCRTVHTAKRFFITLTYEVST